MRLLYPIAAAVLLVGSAFTFITAQSWKIGDNYNIAFSNDATGGIFKGFKGTIAFDEKNLAASQFDVTVDVATVNTGNALMNKHAKSDEWFDAAKYPTIHIISNKVVKAGAGYQFTGTLDMHGVKKPITFPFTYKQPSATTGLFTATFNVNRTDFNIGKPGGDVDNILKVELSVPVTK